MIRSENCRPEDVRQNIPQLRRSLEGFACKYALDEFQAAVALQ
jgi:hypothetical protein